MVEKRQTILNVYYVNVTYKKTKFHSTCGTDQGTIQNINFTKKTSFCRNEDSVAMPGMSLQNFSF